MKPCRCTPLCIRALLLVLLASALSGPATAQNCWVAAGATGVLDPEDIPYVSLIGPHMNVSDTAPFPVSVGARHAVTGIRQDDGVSNRYKYFRIRFRDNGTQGRVLVYLKQVTILTTAGATDLAVFDSDTVASSNDYQSVFWTSSCGAGQGFNFYDNLYFIRVDLTRTSSGGTPSLHSLQVCDLPC